MSVTEQFAELVASVQYEDLPADAIHRSKLLILDHIGVAVAGGRSPLGDLVPKLDSDGVTVLGFGATQSLPLAAFLNATLAHALDIDDTAAGTVAHPSAPILPALFGFAERDRLCGRELLTSYVAGLEAFYRIALASDGGMGGWHRTALFGAPAAAAAAARLLQLDTNAIRASLGISGSFAGGLQKNFGSMTKAVQVGNAGRSGVLAVQLALGGCTADPDLFDGPNSFGVTFFAEDFDETKLVVGFGDPFSVIFPGIGMKLHPCCGLTHAPADIVLGLTKRYGIRAADVTEIVVYGEDLWPDVLVHHEPLTGYQGKYSLEYVLAAAVIDGEITPDTFSDCQVRRPELQAFLSKVRLVVRDAREWDAMRQHPWNHSAEVMIRLTDGTEYVADAPCARGYPDLPLSEQEVLEKFSACAAPTLSTSAIDGIVKMTLGLEDESDVSRLLALSLPSS